MDTQDIFDLIVKNTREVVPDLENHQFTDTDSLRDLGANSVDRSEIIMMTLESLSLSIPLIHVAKAENIGELAELINEEL